MAEPPAPKSDKADKPEKPRNPGGGPPPDHAPEPLPPGRAAKAVEPVYSPAAEPAEGAEGAEGGPKKARPKREKDTRVIVSGVQIYTGGQLKTFAPGQEDDLEDVLTDKDLEHLKRAGALAGDWKAGGPERPPMAGSRAAREAGGGGDAAAENARLKAEIAELKRQALKK